MESSLGWGALLYVVHPACTTVSKFIVAKEEEDGESTWPLIVLA